MLREEVLLGTQLLCLREVALDFEQLAEQELVLVVNFTPAFFFFETQQRAVTRFLMLDDQWDRPLELARLALIVRGVMQAAVACGE